MYPHQSERLTEALDRGGLDALVATSPANVAYVTGFRSVRGAISHTRRFGVFTRGGTALVVPAVDGATVVADAVDADHVICYGGMCATFAEPSTAEVRRARAILAGAAASPEDALVEALTRLGVRQGSVGIDERGLGHGAWLGLSERLTGLEILVAAGHLAEARRVKAPYEIECLDRALRIAEEALDAVVQTIDRGMTEREAATLYTGLVVKRGASPCPALVAIGERTWIPAPWPADRALRTGDLVRFDVGCVYKGYWGSVARTAILGEPAPRVETAYRALQAGLEAATAAVTAGAPAGRLFEAAVAAARAHGLSSYERDHVGAGIGLEPCERPELGAVGAALAPGEVLRVAMPYHEIGSVGLAVSDTLLVTTAGARILNRSRHDLIGLD